MINSTRAIGKYLYALATDKVVKSFALNLLGLQIARILLARVILKVQRLMKKGERSPYVKTLLSDGVVVIPNFLSESDFASVQKEFYANYHSTEGIYKQDSHATSGTVVRKVQFSDNIPPSTRSKLLDHPDLKALFTYGEARVFEFEYCIFEEISFLGDGTDSQINFLGDGTDPQTMLHRDTFFSTHKAFFYIENTKLKDGPFGYINGSNKLSVIRLLHEYLNGLATSRNQTLRFGQHRGRVIRWIERSLEKRVVDMIAPKNTLVVADTTGYHRRGYSSEGGQRRVIRLGANCNPFIHLIPPLSTYLAHWWHAKR